jgi:hypothetical protein
MIRSATSRYAIWIAATAVATTLFTAAPESDAQVRQGNVQQGGGTTQCCLNNFRFAGTCEVTVGPGETCYDVLSFLNNLQSVGRTYCGGTLVRGGWNQVTCQQTSTPGSSVSPGRATTAPQAQSPQTLQTSGTGSVGTTGQTFVTPVDAATVTVQQAGIINF